MKKHILQFIAPVSILLLVSYFIVSDVPYSKQTAQVGSAELVDTSRGSMITNPATNITQTSATLSATPRWYYTNPGTQKLFSQFEFVYPRNERKKYGYGYYAETFKYTVENLLCGTQYSYRGENPSPGDAIYGEYVSFNTLPCQTAKPIEIILSTPKNILAPGGSSGIMLETKNVTRCYSSDIESRELGTSGTFEVGPLFKTKTYEVTCENNSGDFKTASVTIKVAENVTLKPRFVSFTAFPNPLEKGTRATLAWNIENVSSCKIDGIVMKRLFPGQGTVETSELEETKTFVITCLNDQGDNVSGQVTANIQTPVLVVNEPVINRFSASPNPVRNGGQTVVSWQTTYSTECRLNGELVDVSSSKIVTVPASRQYTLVCAGSDGRVTQRSTFISLETVGNNGGGGNESNQNSPIIGGFSVNPLSVPQGEYATLYWNSDADYCRASGAWSGQKNPSGSERVGPINGNQSYTLTCYKNNRTTVQTVTAFTQSVTFLNQNTAVVTTIPTRIRAQTVDLNGTAIIGNGLQTQGWFEWGTTQALGERTNDQLIGTNRTVDFSDAIFNLNPNTRYYYRAVIQNSAGVYRGDISSFTTERITQIVQSTFVRQPINTTRPITQVRTVATQARAATPNPATTLQTQTYARPVFIELITSQVTSQITPNGSAEYKIEYRNITATDLTNTVIKVVLPEEFEYVSATRGIYSNENRTLSLFLGNVLSREQGTFTILGRVAPNSQIGKIVVVTGYINYTIPKTNQFNEYQDEVIAYTVSTIQAGNGTINSQAASIGSVNTSFWRGDFGQAVMWLLLILILLIIIFLLRRIYKTFKSA